LSDESAKYKEVSFQLGHLYYRQVGSRPAPRLGDDENAASAFGGITAGKFNATAMTALSPDSADGGCCAKSKGACGNDQRATG
jgi:hypothetical protein